MDTFNFDCTAGTTGYVTHAVRNAQFGDGYRQIAKDGLNARRSSWTVQMVNLTNERSDAVVDFIEGHAGQAFPWTRRAASGRDDSPVAPTR
jgi:phage-related protein